MTDPGVPPAAAEPVVGRDAVVEVLVAAGRRGTGAVVSGLRGSGRSTVLGAAAARLRDAGEPVLRLVPVAGGPAFAAVRGAVPDLPAAVEAGSLADVGDALLARARTRGDGRPILVVEDVDDVDAPSAAVLHQLLASRQVALLGSARADRSELAAVWWRDLVERVHLDSLPREDADRLAEALVGGPVEAQTRQRLWAFARGHPGWLVTAVRSTQAAGAWERSAGLWSLVGDLDASVDADVLSVVDATSSEVRAVLQALALAGPLPIDDAEALGGPSALAEAERRGLVAVDTDDEGALWCRPASDLVATVLRTSLDPATTRARWARLAEVMEASESGAGEAQVVRGLALLSARRVELDGPVDDDDRAALAAGAEAAYVRSRWDDGARMAERAWRLGAGSDALRLLTQCLGQMNDHAAIGALAADLEATADPIEVVHHAESIAVSQFHMDDAPGTWATFARARELAVGDDARRVLDLAESRLRSFHGDQEAARALTAPWRDDPDPAVRVEVVQMAATAAVHRGAYAEGIAGFDEAFALAVSGPDAPTVLAGVPFLFRLSACADMGRFDEAISGAEAVEPAAAALGDPAGHGWLTLHLGRTHLATGRARTAARWFGESVAALRKVNRPGWLAHPAAGLVAAHALAGDLDAAAEARERWLEVPSHAVVLFRSEELRFAAALRAAEGDGDGALDLLREAHALAARNGSHPYIAGALHDLARLGGPDDRARAAAALAEVAAGTDSPLVIAHAAQARGLADGTVEPLVEAATAYAAMGALVDAAETWAEVSRRATDDRTGAEARRRVDELRAAGEAMSTPLLDDVEGRAVLTEREAEIATLVIAGASRQDIAAHLVVSVRTVDSHLQRVYRKLGVRGREELAAALARLGPR